jgi:hypothetical protein
MADATITLADLEDARRYTVKRGVPIFRAHSRKVKDKDGKEITVTVTDADLPEIAANMAIAQARDGVFGRIVDGHIKPGMDVAEKDQPGLIGLQANPRFATFGASAIPCVMVDQYIRNDRLHIAKERPYRSAEYYPDAKTIRGTALMVRDPFLDLGVVTYVGANTPYLYAMGTDDMDDQMKPDEDQFTPEEVQKYERMCRYMAKKGLIKYGEPSQPAGGNTTIPGEINDPKKEPIMNANEGDPVLYARLEAAEKSAEANAKRVAELLAEREREKCLAIVNSLRVDYSLNADKELERLVVMTGPQRQEHVQYIKENYKPLDGQIQVYSGPVEGGIGQRETSKDTANKAVKVATRKGISYDDALVLVNSGQA